MKERFVVRIVLVCAFVSYVIEIILQADVYPPVDWYAVFVPALFYFLTTHAKVRDKALVELARSSLIVSTGLSFLYHLRELGGPCGYSPVSFPETCDASPNNGEWSECEKELHSLDEILIDQAKCPWVRLGSRIGSFYYAITFTFRLGAGFILPLVVHVFSDSEWKRASWRIVVTDPIWLYAVGTLILISCLFVETLTSKVYYPAYSSGPCALYIVAGIATLEEKRYDAANIYETSDVFSRIKRLLAIASVVVSACDITRNQLLYSWGICAADGQVKTVCDVGDSSLDSCVRGIMTSSALLSEIRNCPINKLGGSWARVILGSQYLRATVVVLHNSWLITTTEWPLGVASSKKGERQMNDVSNVDTIVAPNKDSPQRS